MQSYHSLTQEGSELKVVAKVDVEAILSVIPTICSKVVRAAIAACVGKRLWNKVLNSDVAVLL